MGTDLSPYQVPRGHRREVWQAGREAPRGPGLVLGGLDPPGRGLSPQGKRRGGGWGLGSVPGQLAFLGRRGASGASPQPRLVGWGFCWLVDFFFPLILVRSFSTAAWTKEQRAVILLDTSKDSKSLAVCCFHAKTSLSRVFGGLF